MPVPIGRDLSIYISGISFPGLGNPFEVIVPDPPADPPSLREVRFEVVSWGRLAEDTWQSLFSPMEERVAIEQLIRMVLRVERDLEENPLPPNVLEEMSTCGNYEPMTWTMPVQAFAESLRPLPPDGTFAFLGELNPYPLRIPAKLFGPPEPAECDPDCLCQFCRVQLWREYQQWRREMGLNHFGKRVIWGPHPDTTAWGFSYDQVEPNGLGRSGEPVPPEVERRRQRTEVCMLPEWTDPDGRPLDPHARALWEARKRERPSLHREGLHFRGIGSGL